MSVSTSPNIYNQRRDKFIVIAEGSLTVVTAGTPVLLPSNTSARAVRIFNNNTDGTIAVIGLAATVDALSSPMVGKVVLAYGQSEDIGVIANSNEMAVDADGNTKSVTYQILG